MEQTIKNRRSIRKYTDRPVPYELTEQIVRAGTLAPSSKNRQPWRFTVCEGRAKEDALRAYARGLEREKRAPLLPASAQYLPAAVRTLNIMRQAPVLIFAVNPLGLDLRKPLSPEERIYEICNAQSLGAAMENMTLTATRLGLGSLWICDIFFAYDELSALLRPIGTLSAALAIGYADEAPPPRPRKPLSETLERRE